MSKRQNSLLTHWLAMISFTKNQAKVTKVLSDAISEHLFFWGGGHASRLPSRSMPSV